MTATQSVTAEGADATGVSSLLVIKEQGAGNGKIEIRVDVVIVERALLQGCQICQRYRGLCARLASALSTFCGRKKIARVF